MEQLFELSEVDLELKLISGSPLYVKDIGLIKPLTIREIIDCGYINYNRLLRILTIKKDEFGLDLGEFKGSVDSFEIFMAVNDKSLNEFLENALKLFLRCEHVKVSNSVGCIFVNEIKDTKVIEKDNFKLLTNVLEIQNCLSGVNSVYNPANEKAREIIEKLQNGKQKIQESKKYDEDSTNEISFADIVSSVSVMSKGVNKFNIWDLTLYQLYDEYKRLNVINDYHFTLESLLHGANSKEVDVRHWSSKIRD